jgi:hypothetical protein
MANPTPPFCCRLRRCAGFPPDVPRSRGIPRVHDRRVLSGISSVIRHGLHRRDAPPQAATAAHTPFGAAITLAATVTFWLNPLVLSGRARSFA